MKHKLLAYYAEIFATGMKGWWENRVYLELFSGPGRCEIRDTGCEQVGSPLKVINHEFTKFIFTEISLSAAEALATRLDPFKNSQRAEIWCGDCAEAIQRIHIPAGALTFAFIDPTGIGHAPFALIETLHRKTRCDLLINIQHGMGIKMNIHQYTPDADEQSALTRFLGNERWKSLSQHNPGDFFRGVLDLYKQQLDSLGFTFTGRKTSSETSRTRRCIPFIIELLNCYSGSSISLGFATTLQTKISDHRPFDKLDAQSSACFHLPFLLDPRGDDRSAYRRNHRQERFHYGISPALLRTTDYGHRHLNEMRTDSS